MAEWPTIPTWSDPTLINEGDQYTAADGVTADDINVMIMDLMYLQEIGGLPSGTLNIIENGTYSVYQYATVVVNVAGQATQLSRPSLSMGSSAINITITDDNTQACKVYDGDTLVMIVPR